jgi:hypothetical protein
MLQLLLKIKLILKKEKMKKVMILKDLLMVLMELLLQDLKLNKIEEMEN